MNIDLQIFLTKLNESLTFFLVFPSLVIFGIYLTVKLRCIQVSKLKMGFSYLLRSNKDQKGNISHYQAISTVLAGNFGTGNLSGMAVALSMGGPSALVWMWVMAFLGAAVQYASCLLAVKYRIKDKEGEYVGGPMYYLANGLNLHLGAILFAIFTVMGALTVGNFAQINSMTLPLQNFDFSPVTGSIVIAFLVGLVLLGGIKQIAKLASIIVPIKALLYFAAALFILVNYSEEIIPAFSLMFREAFDFKAVIGGVGGFKVLKAITAGFDRGLFATDAGTGMVPILQASARSRHPVTDGTVTLVAPLAVMIVCTITGLVLIVTGAWQHTELKSTNMVSYAFEVGLNHQIGSYFVMTALMLFGYTTILAWAYCAEKAITFLFNKRMARLFSYFYIVCLPLGAVLQVNFIWTIADLSISCMLLTNLIGVIGLSREVIGESREFFLKDLNLKIAK